MNYILEKVAKITDPAQRRIEAERLLNAFDHPCRWEIPKGLFLFDAHRSCSVQSVEAALLEDEKFYKELRSYVGDNSLAILDELEARFQRNRAQMLRLAAMPERERMALPTHEFAPYCDDFNKTIQWSAADGRVDTALKLKEVVFMPQLVGRGGFACVYLAHDASNKYALKLFHDNQKFRFPHERYKIVEALLETVRKHKEVFKSKPFAAPRVFPGDVKWYVLDFFDGKNVGEEIRLAQNVQDPAFARVALSTYAGMLKILHDKRLLFLDNKWDSVLVNGESAAICDYDAVSSVDDLYDSNFPLRSVFTRAYASREQSMYETPSKVGDLEGFALMIDELFVGNTFIPIDANGFEQREIAKKDEREYPKERAQKLPKQLQQVVAPLLTYPRDNSLTIDDVLAAIAQDFA